MGSAGPPDAAELRRAALAFDDALALLDRRLRSPNADPEEEAKQLARLEAEVAAMEKACAANEADQAVAVEVRAQRTRVAIYTGELKRLRERIRQRTQRKDDTDRRRRRERGAGGEDEVALALLRAHRQADELLDGSREASAALAEQRRDVEAALEEAVSVQGLLVAASSVLGGVQRSRAKQTLLLALLVALCVCVFLYYYLRQTEVVSG